MGTVIHGTFRPQDLIPAFLNELRARAPAAYEAWELSRPVTPGYEDDHWWQSREAQFFIDELIIELDAVAPGGYYFGAHEGDSSDFGFWPEEEG